MRYPRLLAASLVALVPVAKMAAGSHVAVPVALPGAGAHAGFDDMGFVPALDRIVVPGGDSGKLFLIDPHTDAVTAAPTVAPAGAPKSWHDAGTSSAAYVHGYFVASDHADRSLAVVNAANGDVVAHVALASGSDYVRYAAPVHQLWVTEPRAAQIQVFDANFSGKTPAFREVGTISIPGGPESLVVDAQAGRAYTNLWKSDTLAIDLHTRMIVARWPNTCKGSRGLALAPGHQLLFVGCSEGKAVALGLAHDGKVVASAPTGAGVDIIAWNPVLGHLYVPGARSATLTVLALGAGDRLSPVFTVATAKGAHCVATDGRDKAYVCDPRHGRMLAVTDGN